VARVLIAEDDPVIASAMATHLRHAGFDVEVADRGDRAMRKLRFERPDAAIIDLMLPGMDGWQITKDARAEGMHIPVLIVSARASEPDKVHALGLGADDYLAKPFGMPELVARVQALLRRARRDADDAGRRDRIEAPGLVIDPDPGLTALEFRLLYVLASEQGRALTRDQLQQRVWGVPYRPRDRSVDVCVRKVREKLERSPGGYRYIHTHYGVGYRFDAVAAEPVC